MNFEIPPQMTLKIKFCPLYCKDSTLTIGILLHVKKQSAWFCPLNQRNSLFQNPLYQGFTALRRCEEFVNL